MFMYLQARHFALSFQAGIKAKDDFSDTMTFIQSRPYKIRYLYPSLLEPMVEKMWAAPTLSWSRDIPLVSTHKLWIEDCGRILKCLPSASLQETYLKTIQRAYISPWQRGHMVPEETGHCKKCGVTEANFFHCMWDCSKIKRFWHKVLDYVNSTFLLRLHRLPVPCLLLNFTGWQVNETDKQLFSLLVIFMTVAKQCILWHWIKRSVPSLQEFKSRILSIIYYERQKVFPDIERGVKQFYNKWETYLDRLPQDVQNDIQKIFESTSWYLSRQLT